MTVTRMDKIKVCYVVSTGITLKFILINHLKFLRKQGYAVSAVCSAGKWVNDIEKEGITVKTICLKRKLFSPISDLVALIRMFFYFRKEKFDIVHTHTPKAGLLGQLAAKIAGIPIIVNTIHGFYFQKNDNWLKRNFFIFIEKIAAKCSNLIFFVNKEDMATSIEEKICLPEKEIYFGGGVNLERFNPKRFSDSFISAHKKELGINPKDIVIGIVARLVKEKGYLDLFEAVKEIIKKFPKVKLLVAGGLDLEKKDAIIPSIIKKYGIDNNVIFLGETMDIDKIYALIDIFVLPSYREGLGISIIEASAMEKPVVATDIRGCRESVSNGKTGILVPARNPVKLMEAIIYLLENPQERIKFGINGRKKALIEFDENLVFDRIIREYNRLIKERQS